MAKVEHTPGPWVARCEDTTASHDDDGRRFWSILPVLSSEELYRGNVATVSAAAHIDGISFEERDANAHLISAAPELLEACKAMMPHNYNPANTLADDAVIPLDVTVGELRQLAAAIAKAEGCAA